MIGLRKLRWLTPAGDDGFGDPTPEQASGGGISTVYAIPSWQQGISMTANQGSTTMRNMPDVALVANNINIVWGNDFIGLRLISRKVAPAWRLRCGPVSWRWLISKPLTMASRRSVFSIRLFTRLEKAPITSPAFHDITTGSNTNSCQPDQIFRR